MSDEDRSLYILTWLILAAVILAVHCLVSDEINFADAPQYLFYVDNLYFFRSGDWFIFEPLSKLMLIVLRDVTGSSERAVSDAHYVISAVYLVGTLAVFPPSQGNWRGLLMTFALYGPQLAFVTIRATPAYFLVAVAVAQATRNDRKTFVSLAGAVMFHISSVLAIPATATILAKSKIKDPEFLHRPRSLMIFAFVAGLFFLLIGKSIFTTTITIFKAIPFLGKYVVFAFGFSEEGGLSNLINNFAIGHFILLIAISAFTFLFLTISTPATRRYGLFIAVSYILYLLTFFGFSPIAAFRQTPFWAIPAFSIFSWERIGWRGPGHFAFLALALGMFAYQYSRVIIL